MLFLSRSLINACRPLLTQTLKPRNIGRRQCSDKGNQCIVDMRSDVLTKPSQRVLQAMIKATLDDDVFREDQTVLDLEMKMADLFGKEAALFVLSGTMANLIAVSCHCPSRGMEVVLGDKSHVFMWEQAGIAQFSGLQAHTLPNLADGTFDLDEFESSIRPRDDAHQPWTGLVVVENTHNYCGGKVIKPDFLRQLAERAHRNDIAVHMDGARLLNASIALNTPPQTLTQHVDSVSFCFSKGIGAPVGSVIVGSQQLIDRALRMRKAVGGGWRKAGPLAAAALAALEDAPQRLLRDHHNAQRFARAIKSVGRGLVHVDVDGVHTNIIMVEIQRNNITADHFCQRLAKVTEDEFAELRERVAVRVSPSRVPHHIRVCTMSNISEHDIDLAVKKWNFVISEYLSAE